MVESTTTSITPATHAVRHSVGGDDPLIAPLLGHHTQHEVGGADIVAVGEYDPNKHVTVDLDDTGSGDHTNNVAGYAVLAPAIDKVINLPVGDIYNLGITFTYHKTGAPSTSYFKIYRNGAAVGTQRTNNGAGGITTSEIIGEWVNGDHLQIYAYNNASATSHAYDLKVYGGGAIQVVPTWT